MVSPSSIQAVGRKTVLREKTRILAREQNRAIRSSASYDPNELRAFATQDRIVGRVWNVAPFSTVYDRIFGRVPKNPEASPVQVSFSRVTRTLTPWFDHLLVPTIAPAVLRYFGHEYGIQPKLLSKEEWKGGSPPFPPLPALKDGPYIVIAPHRSRRDPDVEGAVLTHLWRPESSRLWSRDWKPARFAAKRSLIDEGLLGFFYKLTGAFPIDRDPRGPKEAMENLGRLVAMLRGGQNIALYPERGTPRSLILGGDMNKAIQSNFLLAKVEEDTGLHAGRAWEMAIQAAIISGARILILGINGLDAAIPNEWLREGLIEKPDPRRFPVEFVYDGNAYDVRERLMELKAQGMPMNLTISFLAHELRQRVSALTDFSHGFIPYQVPVTRDERRRLLEEERKIGRLYLAKGKPDKGNFLLAMLDHFERGLPAVS